MTEAGIIVNPKSIEKLIPPNIKSSNEAKIKTIKILMKLLVIRIVPNNFFGFSRSFTTRLFPFVSSFNSSKSVCESEKNATSVPETNAEHISRTNNAIKLDVVINVALVMNKK